MATTPKLISDLFLNTIKEVTSSPEEWLQFLKTAANNYKYDFSDQLLIYAQKPNATACTDYNNWNNNLDRIILKGSPGIALLSQYHGIPRIHYVWDISDTKIKRGRNRKIIHLWEFNRVYEKELIESLEDKYKLSSHNNDLENTLFNIADILVDDNYIDYINDLLDNKNRTSLKDLSNETIETQYKRLLKNSIAYVLFQRCDLDTEKYFNIIDFRDITLYQELVSVTRVGTAISDISEMGLQEIYLSLKNIRNNEIEKIRTFDVEKEKIYNEAENERSIKNEIEVYGGRKRENSSIDSEREKFSNREIFGNEVRLLDEPQKESISRNANDGYIDRTFGRNREAITEQITNINERPNREREYNRRIESQRPNEMGSPNEHSEKSGRGNHQERDNLHLDFYDIKNDENHSFYILLDSEINEILINTPHLKKSNAEIYDFFTNEKDINKRIDYLKSVFNSDYSGVLVYEKMYWYKTYDNGVLFAKGKTFLNPEAKIFVNWKDLIDNYDAMILLRQLNGSISLNNNNQFSLFNDNVNFEFTQDFVNRYLQSINVETRFDVYNLFQKNLTNKENADYLKEIYGIGGVSHTVNGSGVSEMHDSKGIKFYYGYFEEKYYQEKLFTWSQIAKSIQDLINRDEYFTPAEKNIYPSLNDTTPDSLYSYNVGNKVIIEDKEYEITKIGLFDIELYNPENPLISRTINKVVFNYELEKNSYNDYLKTNSNSEKYYGEYNDEVDIIKYVLHQYKLDDINVSFDSNENIVMYDDDGNTWEGKEVYDLLFYNLFDYNDKGTVDLIDDEAFNRLVDYKKVYDVKTLEREKLENELLNKHITIDNKEYVIDSIDNDLVSLVGSTKKEKDGSYKTDIRTLEEIQNIISNNKETQEVKEQLSLLDEVNELNNVDNSKVIDNIEIEEKPKVIKKAKITNYVLHPEIPYNERLNYKINDDFLGVGTLKEKFKNNIEAIKVLKKCEDEDRYATAEEQEILVKYVGWGGLSQAFDENNLDWSEEYNELKNLLNKEEYEQARDTTLTAFYTPPKVIKAIYKALEQMGFEKGNILEPSCGIGNFIGLLPNNDKLKIYGVEIDSLSGRIARQLYQKSSIAITGFENVDYSDSFFDVAIGNVPFDNHKVIDKRYDKYDFLIHDYFFAKTIDKVRPGGIIAFITSDGTMDRKDTEVRKYISQRADLLGAIRLPNNTFKDNAGTTVTTDIIFLQKKDSITNIEPDWINLGIDNNGLKINKYFVDHPEMILGEMKAITSQYGLKNACLPYEDKDIEDLLNNAINNIHAEIKNYEIEEIEEDNSIEADMLVDNFSYTIIDDKVYYRENSRMYPQALSLTAENRIKGLVNLRNCTRELMKLELENYPDEKIKEQQIILNKLYDDFTKKYGLINSKANSTVFNNDNSYYLLCSLEILDKDGNFERKADIFNKRTILARKEVTKVDTANDALIASLGQKAKVDIPYMQKLCGMSIEKMLKDLEGLIFNIPEAGESNNWVTADEYLSGNIRKKLKIAEEFAKENTKFNINVEYLKKVMPKPLSASEINLRLGSTWVPKKYYEDFMYETFKTNWQVEEKIRINYFNNNWNISEKSSDWNNGVANITYGTKRINGYHILEETLNLREVMVYDYYVDEKGNKQRKLNSKETAIAQDKQNLLKQAFQDWIWKDYNRRIELEKIYNENFNSIKPREFNGKYINFDGMNKEYELLNHQKNAVARILYGGNTLLAHVVGAGKTFEMVASAMESKRLGLCGKSLFVVPNNIVEQFASEFLQLYPAANILVTRKKDFETSNRKKFCSRIATGEYDAIIMAHSQFEKIPMSIESQIELTQKQIEEIIFAIERSKDDNFTVKQMIRTKKRLEAKLNKLTNSSKKDQNVVTFEQLGVDRLFVDEAHYYKNLFLYTKMQNVSGISQTEAQKSTDLYMKCLYLNELTHNKGVIFATGTPISNSMTELYTMQRYLQNDELAELGLQDFDSWASTFGDTTTALELAPEGTGYRVKTRFSKFYNLPELITLFKNVADIQTADMLNLPVPKANYENVVIKPTKIQLETLKSLAERAEKIRNKQVAPNVDNMLKITNDGKKLALDQRLINELFPDDDNNKINVCVKKTYDIYKKYDNQKATQLIFCDLSTPKNDGSFSVYNEIRKKLIEKGIPEEEIAFIHDADTEEKKQALFSKVRDGQVRILLGSTQKMGAGTNCQNKLIAIHNLDCPWRPADLEQRAGRIIRQGNENKEVFIYRYVTEKTFDAYLYQLVENKQKFISQIMSSKIPLRTASDVDETVLSYAEIKALATGNRLILEKTELDNKVSKLKLLKQNYLSQKYELENKINMEIPNKIQTLNQAIIDISKDIQVFNDNIDSSMELKGIKYNEKKDMGNALLSIIKGKKTLTEDDIGTFKGFKMILGYNNTFQYFYIKLKNNYCYMVEMGNDSLGNITRIENEFQRFQNYLKTNQDSLANSSKQLEIAKEEINKPFLQEKELEEAEKKLSKINKELKIDEKVIEIPDEEPEYTFQNHTLKEEYAR